MEQDDASDSSDVSLYGPIATLPAEHLRHIMPIDGDIGHEAIVDILAECMLWKESSVMSSLVTQQVLLFANPIVLTFWGREWTTRQCRFEALVQ